MRSYRVTGKAARFAPDSILGLSPEQYEDRKMYLEPVKRKDHWYRALQTVEFKKGETIGVKGELDKVTRLVMVSTDIEDPENTGADDTSAGNPGEASLFDDQIVDDEIDLEALDDDQLRSMALRLNINGFDAMDRESLMDAIVDASKYEQCDLESLNDEELISIAAQFEIEDAGNLDRDSLILTIMEKQEEDCD